MNSISIIVPVLNESKVLPILVPRLKNVLDSITPNYEVIFVNDGSKDDTLKILEGFYQQDSRFKIIDFSRNFGKEESVAAGLDCSSGDAVIVIDSDLQDPPELIKNMYDAWLNGCDIVRTYRSSRGSDSFVKRYTAKIFYSVYNFISKMPIHQNASDFCLLDRRVVDLLKNFPERSRFMKGLFSWPGFKQTSIPYKRDKRYAGKSSWSYLKLFHLALDGIVSFSVLPLRIFTYIGLLCGIFTLIFFLFSIAQSIFGDSSLDMKDLIFMTIAFFGTLNMLGIGIVGEYISHTHKQVISRPLYIVNSIRGDLKFSDNAFVASPKKIRK